MKLTEDQERKLYIICIEQGVDLTYGKLSLCDLSHYRHSHIRNDRKFQVHCEDNRFPWSMIYDDLESAVTKFLEIKKRVRLVV